MATKVANVANLRSGELIRRRLAEHPYFLPAWLAQIGSYADASVPALPAVDYLPGHAHPSPEYTHLLRLVRGLGELQAGAAHAGIMLSGKGFCLVFFRLVDPGHSFHVLQVSALLTLNMQSCACLKKSSMSSCIVCYVCQALQST